MRTVRLHDTRSGELQVLTPRRGDEVGIYACGPTVYARIHVGNARPFVVFSQLARFLAHEGYEPTLVINVTDVNDKIYGAAVAAGVPSSPLAEEMTAHYVEDTSRLGLGRPDAEPRATETIDSIVGLISELIDRDAAYAVDGDVYFRVRSDPEYGSLSKRRPDQMEQGEGVEGADRKEDPLDFALWKAQKDGEDTSWDAPWGRGRPGWHIECSAMAEDLLGVGFEIHGGGNDLAFPHHENEAAQTRRARDAELAQIWMHNGMLQLGEEKMAKSVGNVAALHAVLDQWGNEALLMFFAGGHYRQPIAFDDDNMAQARRPGRRIREAARHLHDGPSPPEMAVHREAFFDALADDFNTAAALRHLSEWVRESNKRAPGSATTTSGRCWTCWAWRIWCEGEVAEVGAEEQELLERRQTARAERDFAEADRLRDELRARGYEVRDGPSGPELVPCRERRRSVFACGWVAGRPNRSRGTRESSSSTAATPSTRRCGRGAAASTTSGRRPAPRRSRGSRASGSSARRARSSRRGRARATTRASSRRSIPTPTRTSATCSPGPSRCSSPSTRSRTRRTSARSAGPPRPRARPASCCPSGAPRTSRRRSRRRRPGPWSTCPSPSCATSRTRSARRATPDAGSTARRPGRARATTPSTGAGGSSSSSARRAGACARASRRAATTSCPCRCEGASNRST